MKINVFLLFCLNVAFSTNLNRFSSKVLNPNNDEIKESLIKFQTQPEESQITELSGLELIEGDILIEKKPKRKRRKIINEFEIESNWLTRWPDGIIPYEINMRMSSEMIQRIKDAINHWETNTCIRFELYNRNRHRAYSSKVVFTPSQICGAFVGYKSDLPISNVYLSTMCQFGTVVHEIGHVIGFRHEHSRVDRDSHVSIDYALFSSTMRDQYDKMTNPQLDYYGVPYDLYSVMHYSSQNGIIKALDSRRNFLMGQRLGLSFLDVKLANLAYKCGSRCSIQLNCQNEGYLDQSCKCSCPIGFTGRSCEIFLKQESNVFNSVKLDENLDLTCDFSNRNLCIWLQDKSRATNEWSFNKEIFTETQLYFKDLDPEFKTGPQLGTQNFIYLNSLRKQTSDANSVLSTPYLILQRETSICLQFSYHMYASDKANPKYPLKIGKLSLNLITSYGSSELWSRNGSQSVNWIEDKIDIELLPPKSLIFFEAQLDGHNYGDIGLSQIKYTLGKCNLQTTWSEWTPWSNCTCEQQYNFRVRECRVRDRRACKGPEIEYRKCVCSKISEQKDVDCGGQFNLNQTIQQIRVISPNYPQQYPTNKKCYYLIRSPTETKISLRIIDLDLEVSEKNICVDYIEMRYFSFGQPGPSYCGTTVPNRLSSQVQINSYSNYFLIIFNSAWGQDRLHRGFYLIANLSA